MQLLENNSTGTSYGRHSNGHGSTKSLETAIPFTIVSGTFSLFGGFSNLILMIVLIKYVQITQKTYLYMLSLFLSEVLYNFLFQPQVAYYRFPSSTPTVAGMKFLHFCSFTFLLTGVSSLFFATLDKYMFISYPFFYASHISQTKTIQTIAFIWLFCVFSGVFRVVSAYPNFNDVFAAIMVVLFLLTIGLQVMIFILAQRHNKRIQLVNRVLEHNPRGENSGEVLRTISNPNKAAKTIGLMLVIYVFSWLPSTLYRLQYHWFGGDHAAYVVKVIWMNALIQIHSCINPYIFVLRTKEVRRGVENMLRRFGVNRVIPFLSDHRESHLNGYNRGAMNNLYIGETHSADVNGNEYKEYKESETTTSNTNSTHTKTQ